MGNWESHVSSVPADKLEEFIQNKLKPYEEYQKRINDTVDIICRILMGAKQHPRVHSVAKGDSYGRDTVLRGESEGTLVVFLDHLEQFQDQRKSQTEALRALEQRLQERLVDVTNLQSHLYLCVSTTGQKMHLQILPAFNPLGQSKNPSRYVYRDLKSSMDRIKASPGEFSICFTVLQQEFFSKYPRKVKDLILLIKYWYQQCQKKWNLSSSLSSYALELLTVYAWEQGCQAEDFDVAEGVRTVLGLLEKPEQLCIYWTVYYNFEDELVRNILLHQLRSPRPVILDPTDPTNNVTRNIPWKQLAEDARHWLSSPSLNHVLPAPRWNVLPAPLFITPGHLLDKFIKDFLQPNNGFLEQIHKAVDIICTFLKENCFRNTDTKVLKVIKGGSTAKGTSLKTGSDADIVVFLSSLKSYASQKTFRSQVVQEIQQQLEACQRQKEFEVKLEISKWKAPRVLSFTMKSRHFNESVDFDVLPAYDALGQVNSSSAPRPNVYAQLIDLYKSPHVLGGEFSTCFTELQRNFIENRTTKLKDLIRLVKYWYKQCERKMKCKGSLPPKYALELLTVYAWEQGSGMDKFDTAEGFRTVLELVTKYKQLCIFWTVNYSFEDQAMSTFLLTQIQKTRPLILDPADPTGDVGGGDRWCWHFLAKEAKEWLSYPCFLDGSGNAIESWDVPTMQMPGSCGIRIY